MNDILEKTIKYATKRKYQNLRKLTNTNNNAKYLYNK